MKCAVCFFMGCNFKFDMSIDQCDLVFPKKYIRVKGDKYVQWIIAQTMGEQFKGDTQTIAIMLQRLAKMPTPNKWDDIKGGNSAS